MPTYMEIPCLAAEILICTQQLYRRSIIVGPCPFVELAVHFVQYMPIDLVICSRRPGHDEKLRNLAIQQLNLLDVENLAVSELVKHFVIVHDTHAQTVNVAWTKLPHDGVECLDRPVEERLNSVPVIVRNIFVALEDGLRGLRIADWMARASSRGAPGAPVFDMPANRKSSACSEDKNHDPQATIHLSWITQSTVRQDYIAA